MLIVIAEKEEMKLIPEQYKHDPIIITGVGALNVMKALEGVDRDIEILNVGYAGSNHLEVGTRAHISSCTLYHINADYQEPVHYLGTMGYRCYSSTDFVTVNHSEAPALYDMELAFILGMGFTNVQSIKVVSDKLNYKEYKEVTK